MPYFVMHAVKIFNKLPPISQLNMKHIEEKDKCVRVMYYLQLEILTHFCRISLGLQ